MEPWAQRIKESLDAQGLNAAGLARACKIKAGSVSGWFGQGKPTKMISGDNLVAAAAFLRLSPEFIMTGRGGGSPSSQSLKPDTDKIVSTVTLLSHYLDLVGLPREEIRDPVLLETAYAVVEEFGQPVSASNVLDLTKILGQRIRGAEHVGQQEVGRTRAASGG